MPTIVAEIYDFCVSDTLHPLNAITRAQSLRCLFTLTNQVGINTAKASGIRRTIRVALGKHEEPRAYSSFFHGTT